MADTVWATGFWPAGFWAEDFWASGDAPPPTPSPSPPSPSGGWVFHYEMALARRRKRKREIEEAQAESERIEDETTRQIAALMRKQERRDEEREYFERLKNLAREYREAALPPRVSDALQIALQRETMSALRALDKELRRVLEEEEMAVLLMMLND